MAVYFVAVYVLLFDVAAEWFFWDEFDSRYNFVAVDYLVYTQEVIGNALESYPVVPILGGLAVASALIAWLTRGAFRRAIQSTSTWRTRLIPGLAHVAGAVLAFTLVGESLSTVSANHYANEVAKNGLYSFGYALVNNTIDFGRYYVKEEDAEAFADLRGLLKSDEARFVDAGPLDITRTITHSGPEKRANVVLVVIESFSAKYLGIFGSTDGVSPNFDALAGQGLLFRNLYATGTRTDRGLEAITASLPPTPGRSMLKRPDNANLFTVGPLFRARGYQTKFIYSGYSAFDNMQDYFSANSFEEVEGGDFRPEEITFKNAWGVCDEDLYRRVVRECDTAFAAGKPFFHLCLTTSNHRPFTFPPAANIPPGKGRLRGVRYTDYAIGKFLAEARTKPWFDNTIFLFIADHCASSAGKAEVTVASYHIPLLIYAPKLVKPGTVEALGSQMDVAPTLLALLNFSYTSKFFGRDLLTPGPERAFVGNYEKVGLFAGGKLLLLLPKKITKTYEVMPSGQREVAEDPALRRQAVGYYQSADYLLRNHLYTAE
jgi:phosphoglycerol transferase MdoB-like AlkP superfamily enzyme